jgi:hypothetical protein
MAASFLARLYLYNYSLGIRSTNWYTWDELKGQPKAVQAYQTIVSSMVGSSLTTPCAPVGADPGVYTCELTRAGKLQEVVWDNSKLCSGGVCQTTDQTVPTMYTTYSDIDGQAPVAIVNHKVPVGIKPLLLK